jgi:tetratricopeptide (TPR) repeat protein
MRFRTAVVPVLLVIAVHAQLSARDAATETHPDRLESVRRLIEISSAARQIEMSGSAQAKAGRQRARSLFEGATAAYESGDLAQTKQLLEAAARAMFDSVRLVQVGTSITDKHKRDYEDRLASIEALRAAFERISEEKQSSAADHQALDVLIEQKEAAALSADGKYKEARAVLDEAYVAAKIAIERFRGGDTLVRELSFETEEEEYHYELDRNDTHRMLVDILVGEKMKTDSGLEGRVRKFMEEADRIRVEADAEAGKGEYGAAVQRLEESTRQIMRAIRSAGIYIPG